MTMRPRLLCLLAAVCAMLAAVPGTRAQDETWQEVFGSIPILDGGRVMPLDTYARRLAVDLTGRTSWREGKGPADYSGAEPIELLADLMAGGREIMSKELIYIGHHGTKVETTLNPERRFFQPIEIMRVPRVREIAQEIAAKREANDKVKPSSIEQTATDTLNATMVVANLATDMTTFALVPKADSTEFLSLNETAGQPGTESVQAALAAFLEAHRTDGDRLAAAKELKSQIQAAAPLSAEAARQVRLEQFYNAHQPWRMAMIAAMVALLCFLVRWLTRLKVFTYLAAAAIVWTVGEQVLGLSLRIIILDRPPVSNTYEAILWMGIVSLAMGLVGQAISPKSWYVIGGLGASLVSLIFAQMVPLTDQTNAIPAVLRSNYWLIVHVMTIVASYGAFLLAAVLGHAFLIRDVILRKKPDPKARLIVQTYRLMQVGLLLLTAGTILGGVWAAESWGRFWGWDPKETWALISILVYLAMLHARYSGWIRDFGLSVASIIGFISIVWCFYGVNYVMATGLHSYGFGSGGEKWVAVWGVAELAFIAVCFARHRAGRGKRPTRSVAPAEPKPDSDSNDKARAATPTTA